MEKVTNNINLNFFNRRENAENNFIKIDSPEIRYGKSIKPVAASYF